MSEPSTPARTGSIPTVIHEGLPTQLPDIDPDETAVDGAVREAVEEAGLDPRALDVLTTVALEHPDWSYTTVVAVTTGAQDPRATDPESLEVRWVAVQEVTTLPLLPAFAEAWPDLRRLLPG